MSKQTEALKLALGEIKRVKAICLSEVGIGLCNEVVIARIEEALAEESSGTEQPSQTDWEAVAADQAMTIALLKAEQPAQQEPVAWMYDWTAYGQEGETVIRDWISADYDEAHSPTNGCHNIRPLYTSPPASKPLMEQMVVAAARMLSDRQAAACNVDCGDMWKIHGNDFLDDARAALEAAHGIKGNT